MRQISLTPGELDTPVLFFQMVETSVAGGGREDVPTEQFGRLAAVEWQNAFSAIRVVQETANKPATRAAVRVKLDPDTALIKEDWTVRFDELPHDILRLVKLDHEWIELIVQRGATV